MRLLHVIPTVDLATGGPVFGLMQLCKVYQNAGHELEVVTFDTPEFAQTCGFPAKVIGLGRGWGKYGYHPRADAWFEENVSKYDGVVIRDIWGYPAVSAYKALKRKHLPYAVYTHGMLDPYFQKRYPLKHLKKLAYWFLFLKEIVNNAHSVYFTSEDEMVLARESFPGYHVHEKVVPYGTLAPNYDCAAASAAFLERWPHLRDKRIALHLGRIHPKKATDILIAAFAKTLAPDPAWHLVIAGPDPVGWKKQLEKLATGLGVNEQITWTGMLDGALKWGSMSAAEVFVLPSHQENFGIVVSEALSCGLPVILSNKVNIWQKVVRSGAGIVADDTLEGTYASLVTWSRMNTGQITAMQSCARDCWQKQFNIEARSGDMLQITRDLVQANPHFLH